VRNSDRLPNVDFSNDSPFVFHNVEGLSGYPARRAHIFRTFTIPPTHHVGRRDLPSYAFPSTVGQGFPALDPYVNSVNSSLYVLSGQATENLEGEGQTGEVPGPVPY